MKPESDGSTRGFLIEVPVSSVLTFLKKKREREAIERIKRYEEIRKANAGTIPNVESDQGDPI